MLNRGAGSLPEDLRSLDHDDWLSSVRLESWSGFSNADDILRSVPLLPTEEYPTDKRLPTRACEWKRIYVGIDNKFTYFSLYLTSFFIFISCD
jgi:hypothetical protein